MAGKDDRWLESADCLAEIQRVRPQSHPGKELANAAMTAGFRARARLAVFLATDGTGRVVERRQNLEIDAAWWEATYEGAESLGLQWIDLSKGEGMVVPQGQSEKQHVMLYGIAYLREDVALHFGLSAAVERPSRGFRESDLKLVEKMRQWLTENSQGIPAAAAEFAPQAEGHGTLDSKAKRLERLYVGESKAS